MHEFIIDERRGCLVGKFIPESTSDIIDDLEAQVGEESARKRRPAGVATAAPSARMLDCLRDAIRQGGVIRKGMVPGVWKTAAQEWKTGTVQGLQRRGWVVANAGRFVVTNAGRLIIEEADKGVGRE